MYVLSIQCTGAVLYVAVVGYIIDVGNCKYSGLYEKQ